MAATRLELGPQRSKPTPGVVHAEYLHTGLAYWAKTGGPLMIGSRRILSPDFVTSRRRSSIRSIDWQRNELSRSLRLRQEGSRLLADCHARMSGAMLYRQSIRELIAVTALSTLIDEKVDKESILKVRALWRCIMTQASEAAQGCQRSQSEAIATRVPDNLRPKKCSACFCFVPRATSNT